MHSSSTPNPLQLARDVTPAVSSLQRVRRQQYLGHAPGASECECGNEGEQRDLGGEQLAEGEAQAEVHRAATRARAALLRPTGFSSFYYSLTQRRTSVHDPPLYVL